MKSVQQSERRRFIRDSMFLAAAGAVAGEAVGAESSAAPATKLPFANLKPQSPINIRADAYGLTALNLSRFAAMTTRCKLDIPYGTGEAQRLDVYMPQDKSAKGLPVFMNIHGGGWTHGYKEWMGLNAPAITQFPAVYVSIEYGLSPTQRHPKMLQDCLEAVAWVYKNIASFGGDPQRLFIGGHSAGAHLSSLVTVRRDLFPKYGLPLDVIKGCLPYSGVYDFRDVVAYGQPPTGGPEENLLTSKADAVDASPIMFLEGLKTPFFVTWTENDNVLVKAESPPFLLALREHGVRAEGHMFPLFDHFWIHIDQQNPNNLWTRTLRNWMTGDPRTAAIG